MLHLNLSPLVNVLAHTFETESQKSIQLFQFQELSPLREFGK